MNITHQRKSIEKKLDYLKETIITDMSSLNEVLKHYEELEELNDKISAIEDMTKVFEDNNELDEFSKWRRVDKLNYDKDNLENRRAKIGFINEKRIISKLQVNHDLLMEYLYYKSLNY